VHDPFINEGLESQIIAKSSGAGKPKDSQSRIRLPLHEGD